MTLLFLICQINILSPQPTPSDPFRVLWPLPASVPWGSELSAFLLTNSGTSPPDICNIDSLNSEPKKLSRIFLPSNLWEFTEASQTPEVSDMLVVWPQMVLTIIQSVILYGAAQEGKTVCLCYHGSKGVKDASSLTSHTINSQSQWLSVSAKCAWNNSYERDYGSVEYSKSFVNSTGNVQLNVRNYGSLNSWTLDQSFDLQGHTRSYSCSPCSWSRLTSTTVSNNRRNTLR